MALNPSFGPPEPTPPARSPISPALLVVAILVVAGISVAATAAYYELKPSSSPAGPGTTTVVDDLGRTVSAPLDAPRVVALAPSVVDILDRLGLESRLVGVGCTASLSGGIYNEYSPNQTALWGLSNASCVTDYPTLNTEAVANLSPTLVLASTLTSAVAVDQLSNTYHLAVVILAPSTIEGIVGDVRIVASLFPSAAHASDVLEAELESSVAWASSNDANLSSLNESYPTVLVSYYFDSGGFYTYGPGSFGASLIDLAGGSNLAAGVPLLYAEVNATVVLNDQPSLIVYGTSWNDPNLVSGETPSVWTTAPYWDQYTGQKLAIEVTTLTEPGPTLVFALPYLQYLLHPSLPEAPPPPPPPPPAFPIIIVS